LVVNGRGFALSFWVKKPQ
jgi:hypothetical protein